MKLACSPFLTPCRRRVNPPWPWACVLAALVFGLTTHYETALAKTPQPSTTQYEYDPNGNLIRIIDPLGRVTVQRYDTSNRLIERQLPSPSAGASQPVVAYGYDARDQLTGVKARAACRPCTRSMG